MDGQYWFIIKNNCKVCVTLYKFCAFMVSITLYVRMCIFSRNICELHFRFVDGCSTYVLNMTAPEAKYVRLDRRFGYVQFGEFSVTKIIVDKVDVKVCQAENI